MDHDAKRALQYGITMVICEVGWRMLINLPQEWFPIVATIGLLGCIFPFVTVYYVLRYAVNKITKP